jgi:hypothetical protein
MEGGGEGGGSARTKDWVVNDEEYYEDETNDQSNRSDCTQYFGSCAASARSIFVLHQQRYIIIMFCHVFELYEESERKKVFFTRHRYNREKTPFIPPLPNTHA